MAGTEGFNASAMAESRSLYQKMSDLVGPPNLYQTPDQKKSPSSKFPGQIGSTNPQDDIRGLQSQLIGTDGIVPGAGLAVADSGYFDYAQEKRQEGMAWAFKQNVLSQADFSRPESAAWWFEKFPWMLKMKVDEIERQAKIQTQLAKIAITGPQSEDDFLLLWLKQNDVLGDRNVALYNLNDDNLGYAKDFKSGAFSVFSKKQNTILTAQPGVGSWTGFAPDTNPEGETGYTFPWNNPVLGSKTAIAGGQTPLGGNKNNFKSFMNFGG